MNPNVRSEELDTVHEALHAGEQTVHLYGEPGVGVNQFLDQVLDDLDNLHRIRGLTVRRSHTPETIAQDLLTKTRDAAGSVKSIKNQLTGGNLSLGPISVGAQLDGRARHIQKFHRLSRSLSTGDPLVLYLKDVHKIAPDSSEQTRDFLEELAGGLGPAVRLLTTGRIPYDDAACPIELGMYDEEETGIILRQAFDNISDNRVEEIHSAIDGHPYYLQLLVETSDSEPELEIRDNVYDYIEQQYLNSLTEREETFLRYTSPLIELDAELCANVLDEFSRTEVRQTLERLREKTVIRELGRSDESGLLVYNVHTLFREFLYERTDDTDAVHRAAFQYYAHKAFAEQDNAQTAPLQGFAYSTFAGIHLEYIHGENPAPRDLAVEIDKLGFEPRERINFVVGFAPYTPFEHHSRLLALEIDRFRERFAETVKGDGEPNHDMGLLMIDLLRGSIRSNASIEFETTSREIYESMIDEAHAADFTEELEEPYATALQDGLVVLCRLMLYQEATGEEAKQTQQRAILDLLEVYGLSRDAALGFHSECRDFSDTLESNLDVEATLESRVDSMMDGVGDGGMVRTSLIQMQDNLFLGILDEFSELGNQLADDSEWVIEFIEKAGEELGRADNPVFATIWYQVSVQLLSLFTTDEEVLSLPRERFKTYREERRKYEKQIESPLIEADEITEDEAEMPDFLSEIATANSQQPLPEPDGGADAETDP